MLGHAIYGVTDGYIDEAVAALHGLPWTHQNRPVFAAIESLHRRGSLIDPATVVEQLASTGDLEKIGGPGYLGALGDANDSVRDHREHIAVIAQHHASARAVTALQEAITRITAGDPPDSVFDAAATDIRQHTIGFASGIPDQTEALAAYENIYNRRDADTKGVPTGWAEFDNHTGGHQPGQLIIVAGRTGTGKSLVAAEWLANAADRGLSAYMCTLEMQADEVWQRILARKADVSYGSMTRGEPFHRDEGINAAAEERLSDALNHILNRWTVSIDDSARTLSDIRRRARTYEREHLLPVGKKLDVLFIDHALLVSPEIGVRHAGRREEIVALTREAKLMAGALGIPVVLLTQINRNGTDHPTITDLKESGSFEEDANTIVLLHRETAVDPGSDGDDRLMVILAKLRSGEAGKIWMREWNGDTQSTSSAQ